MDVSRQKRLPKILQRTVTNSILSFFATLSVQYTYMYSSNPAVGIGSAGACPSTPLAGSSWAQEAGEESPPGMERLKRVRPAFRRCAHLLFLPMLARASAFQMIICLRSFHSLRISKDYIQWRKTTQKLYTKVEDRITGNVY